MRSNFTEVSLVKECLKVVGLGTKEVYCAA